MDRYLGSPVIISPLNVVKAWDSDRSQITIFMMGGAIVTMVINTVTSQSTSYSKFLSLANA